MALRAGVGKAMKFGAYGMGALIAGATVATASTVHGMVTDKPRNTPLMDAIFEGVIGDPQADRHILGTDVGLSTFYGLPSFMQMPALQRNLKLVNPKTFGDISQSDQRNLDDRSFNQFALDQAQDYVQGRGRSTSVRRNYNATGDIVFGMYNSRMG